MLIRFWNALWRPSKLATATLLILGGFLSLLLFGSFSVFMHHSNSLEFCTSCHEMDTPYREYAQSSHAANRSGAHAVCADCHVPKALGPMLVRKVMATNHVIQMVLGKIDTPEKYENHRLQMAQKVWDYMEKRKSRECHNCHAYDNMIETTQNEKARRRHKQGAKGQEACVSCHKGIAHRLPDFDAAVENARQTLDDSVAVTTRAATSDTVFPARSIKFYDTADGASLGSVLAGAPLSVLERQDGWLRVQLEGWRPQDKQALILTSPDNPAFRAGLNKSGREVAKPVENAPQGPAGWEQVRLSGWVENADVVGDAEPIWEFAQTVYDLKCGQCHRAYPVEQHTADEWADYMKAMKPYAKLEREDHRLVQIYLQTFAAPPHLSADKLATTNRQKILPDG